MSGREEKKALRASMLQARAAIEPEARRKADKAINEAIVSLSLFKEAKLLAGYASDGTEPDLAECFENALKSGKRLCLPRTSASGAYGFAECLGFPGDLVAGKYGLLEPRLDAKAVEPGDLKEALWLVPGVAFDERGGRLGRGKGVYDRLLAESGGLSIVGVFYERQKCASVPNEGHDRLMDCIVTEAGVRDASIKRKEEAGK